MVPSESSVPQARPGGQAQPRKVMAMKISGGLAAVVIIVVVLIVVFVGWRVLGPKKVAGTSEETPMDEKAWEQQYDRGGVLDQQPQQSQDDGMPQDRM
jgi:hypothetical protein